MPHLLPLHQTGAPTRGRSSRPCARRRRAFAATSSRTARSFCARSSTTWSGRSTRCVDGSCCCFCRRLLTLARPFSQGLRFSCPFPPSFFRSAWRGPYYDALDMTFFPGRRTSRRSATLRTKSWSKSFEVSGIGGVTSPPRPRVRDDPLTIRPARLGPCHPALCSIPPQRANVHSAGLWRLFGKHGAVPHLPHGTSPGRA